MPGSSRSAAHSILTNKQNKPGNTGQHCTEDSEAYGVNILFPISIIAITVPQPLAVFLAIAVVPAVLAVAVIVVAVTSSFHVQAVDNGAQTRQTLVGVQLVDELVVVLMRIVGTAYVNADIGNACAMRACR